MFKSVFAGLISRSHLSKSEVGRRLGVSPQVVNGWLNGTEPDHSTLKKISAEFDVSIDFLLGNSEILATPELKSIPVIDEIPSGDPRSAKDYHCNDILIHNELASTFDFGYLVQDKSMENAGILHLDIVFIQYEAPIDHGQIYLTTVDGKALLARIFVEPDFYILKRESNQYKPILVNRKKPANFRLVGKVSGLFRPDPIPYEDPG
jgi:SOS-response transcriptional repressor LexA